MKFDQTFIKWNKWISFKMIISYIFFAILHHHDQNTMFFAGGIECSVFILSNIWWWKDFWCTYQINNNQLLDYIIFGTITYGWLVWYLNSCFNYDSFDSTNKIAWETAHPHIEISNLNSDKCRQTLSVNASKVKWQDVDNEWGLFHLKLKLDTQKVK